MSRKISFFVGAILLLVVVLLVSDVSAERSAEFGTTGRWRVFSTEDGLISKKIEAVTQDKDGNFWIGTDKGLQKLEVVRPWPVFLRDRIRVLRSGADGTLWIGADSGLYSIKGNGLRSFPFPDNEPRKIYSIWVASGSRVWCGTSDGVWILKDGVWERTKGLPKDTEVFSVSSTNSTPLAGTRGALYGYSDGSWKRFSVPVLPKDATVSSILVARNGDIWLGTDRGLVLHATKGSWERPISVTGMPGEPNVWIWKLLEDDDGSIWVSTDGYGVCHIKDGRIQEHFTSSTGLSSPSVKDIFRDLEGGLWFATDAGLDRYDRYTWSYYISPDRTKSIVSGTSTHDGTAWVVAYREGVWKFDGKDWKPCPLNKAKLSFSAIAAAPDGNVWIGTEENGIIEISPSCKVLEKKFTINGANVGIVNALAVTPKGELWVATNEGVFRRTEKGWDLYLPTDYGANGNSVRSLSVDKEGRVWLGTDDDTLEVFDGDSVQTFTPKNSGLPESRGIWSIAFSRNGVVWLGLLDAGVASFDGNSWKLYSDDVLPSKDVFSVYAAPDGEVWVGTNGGVGRFDGSTWVRYTTAQGLPDNEVSWVGGGKGGSVWFGGPTGELFRYRRGKMRPKVGIELVNGRVNSGQEITVRSNELVSIGFFGVDTKTPSSSLYYRYMLRGRDKVWSVQRDVNHVEYASLPPGNYEFVLQAIDEDLLYSKPATLKIKVVPAPSSYTLPVIGVSIPKGAAIALFVMGALLLLSTANFVASVAIKKGKKTAAIRRHFNPYIAGTPVSDERMFFGREDVLRGLISTIHRNNVMILGERRIGKTSLLQYLTKRLKGYDDPEYFFVPLYIDLEGVSEEKFFHFLAEEIYSGLSAGGYSVPPKDEMIVFRKNYKEYSDRDFRRDLKAIILALQKDAREKHLRLTLLLDEVDVMGSYSSQTQQLIRRLFMESFAQYLGVLVAGVRINKAWDRVESPWYNMFTQIELAPLKREEAEQLIREPVKGVYVFDDDAVEFIWEQSKGKPFYIQQLCMESVNTMLRDEGKKGRITLKHVTSAYNRLVSVDKSLSSRV